MNPRLRTLLADALGIAVCSAVFLAADAIGRVAPLPLPPNIVGAIALAVAMLARVVPLAWVAPGGDRLLRHLGLFFVPASVLALRQRAILAPAIGGIVVVVAVSSTVAIVVAGAVTQRLARLDRAPGEDAAAAREEEAGT